jgi:RNA polymerase sigma factor (sigma-70 family)
MRKPKYGELDYKNISLEVKNIWLTKDKELDSIENEVLIKEEFSFDAIEQKLTLKKIIEQMETRLSDRQKEILYLRYFLEKTLKEIGEIFGIQTERVRRIECKALWKIRSVIYKSKHESEIKYLKYKREAAK